MKDTNTTPKKGDSDECHSFFRDCQVEDDGKKDNNEIQRTIVISEVLLITKSNQKNELISQEQTQHGQTECRQGILCVVDVVIPSCIVGSRI